MFNAFVTKPATKTRADTIKQTLQLLLEERNIIPTEQGALNAVDIFTDSHDLTLVLLREHVEDFLPASTLQFQPVRDSDRAVGEALVDDFQVRDDQFNRLTLLAAGVKDQCPHLRTDARQIQDSLPVFAPLP